MSHKLPLIAVLFALSACSSTINLKKGYITYKTYGIRVGDAGNRLEPSGSWVFENKRIYTGGSLEKQFRTQKISSREHPTKRFWAARLPVLLEFSHNETGASILYTVVDISPVRAALKLDVLLDRFISAISGDHTFLSLSTSSSLFHSKRLVATTKEVVQSGKPQAPILRATLEVRDPVLIKLLPLKIEWIVKIVLQRFTYLGKTETTWGKPQTFNALSIALYIERPRYLSVTQQDFDSFLKNVHILPGNSVSDANNFTID
ncbi:hypothetical protein KKF84_01520 [Myxococcota bacterium]|nr:hypothetical protein [Myxococcota bacterium]MBU1533964.1 hypothetical protein [Myxococcota bacterium]